MANRADRATLRSRNDGRVLRPWDEGRVAEILQWSAFCARRTFHPMICMLDGKQCFKPMSGDENHSNSTIYEPLLTQVNIPKE
jgi:hypothetical protein